ncbi:DUF1049 domain-containing protein [Streptomyces fagopyri]|uniref:DUF1049 domain-containing protein n=1 Tax=Streptomyces fagopyri TaxID=2662397 RepID=A0A5Q0L8U2_9ACTN|nr:DUF1049 domain-containing protein [Streptomyces fagopyri]QFZ73462.1 DUF1049 domain-containing protein [Streptomyces fagopyri]
MSPKTPDASATSGAKSRAGLMTPGRTTVMALVLLAMVFVFENTRSTKIRLLIPEVTTPLWMALLGTGAIGALCGAYSTRRRP